MPPPSQRSGLKVVRIFQALVLLSTIAIVLALFLPQRPRWAPRGEEEQEKVERRPGLSLAPAPPQEPSSPPSPGEGQPGGGEPEGATQPAPDPRAQAWRAWQETLRQQYLAWQQAQQRQEEEARRRRPLEGLRGRAEQASPSPQAFAQWLQEQAAQAQQGSVPQPRPAPSPSPFAPTPPSAGGATEAPTPTPAPGSAPQPRPGPTPSPPGGRVGPPPAPPLPRPGTGPMGSGGGLSGPHPCLICNAFTGQVLMGPGAGGACSCSDPVFALQIGAPMCCNIGNVYPKCIHYQRWVMQGGSPAFGGGVGEDLLQRILQGFGSLEGLFGPSRGGWFRRSRPWVEPCPCCVSREGG